jgi:hypothetical protein
MQVLMSRTVNVDEEELLLATDDRAKKMIKTTVKVRLPLLASRVPPRLTCAPLQSPPAPDAKPTISLMESLSSSLTSSFTALGSMLSASDPSGSVKDWCVALDCRARVVYSPRVRVQARVLQD